MDIGDYYTADLRWLNRDPVEELGGCNLYAFCNNSPEKYIDITGTSIIVIKHIPGTRPPTGWKSPWARAQTEYISPKFSKKEVPCNLNSCGGIGKNA